MTPTYTTCSPRWDKTWSVWNHQWTSSITYEPMVITTTATSDSIWREWNRSSYHIQYGRATSNSSTTWASWNSDRYVVNTTTAWLPPRETSEQREAREAAHRAREEERRLARRTAHQLLMTVLDDEQAIQYDLEKTFTTVGSDGRRYLLTLGRQHNVFVLDDQGRRVEELCGHVGEYVPDEDNLVAQKLRIETDALGFRRVCNIWDVRQGRRIIHQSGAPLREELAVA